MVTAARRDIGRGAVDLHIAALLDPRSDQRDIAVLLERVDLRAVHDLDRAAVAVARGEKLALNPLASLLLSVGLIEVSSKPADVEYALWRRRRCRPGCRTRRCRRCCRQPASPEPCR